MQPVCKSAAGGGGRRKGEERRGGGVWFGGNGLRRGIRGGTELLVQK